MSKKCLTYCPISFIIKKQSRDGNAKHSMLNKENQKNLKKFLTSGFQNDILKK